MTFQKVQCKCGIEANEKKKLLKLFIVSKNIELKSNIFCKMNKEIFLIYNCVYIVLIFGEKKMDLNLTELPMKNFILAAAAAMCAYALYKAKRKPYKSIKSTIVNE